MVRRNLQTVSDERVRAATGEGRDHWFAMLDSAGAREWRHGRTAEFLGGLGVSAWWAQSLTVAYEQERGLRLPGQRPDGTFDANASRTLRVTRALLWPLLTDDDARASWLGDALPLTGGTEWSSVRLAGPEGSRVTFWLDWLDDDVDPSHGDDPGGGGVAPQEHTPGGHHDAPGGGGVAPQEHTPGGHHDDPGGGGAAPGRVRLSVQHSRLHSLAAVEEWRPRWKAALARLSDEVASRTTGT